MVKCSREREREKEREREGVIPWSLDFSLSIRLIRMIVTPVDCFAASSFKVCRTVGVYVEKIVK